MAVSAIPSTPGEQVQRAATLTNVLYEKKGPIAYVTLNRPKVLNALSHGAWEDLRTAFEQARAADQVNGRFEIRVWQEDESPEALVASILKEWGVATGKLGVRRVPDLEAEAGPADPFDAACTVGGGRDSP